jgi:hypothetical protein
MISHEEKIELSQPLTLEERRSFLKLPLEERRRRLAEQAKQMAEHYDLESSREERAEWQGGDIIEY